MILSELAIIYDDRLRLDKLTEQFHTTIVIIFI